MGLVHKAKPLSGGGSGDSGISKNILLNRTYGLNKAVTGELSQYLFSGGNDYNHIGFGSRNTGYADLDFIAIPTTNPNTYFLKTIDLTNINSITIISPMCRVAFEFAVGTTISLATKSISGTASTNEKTYTLDVSDLTGEYYLGFKHTNGTWAVISSIVLS